MTQCSAKQIFTISVLSKDNTVSYDLNIPFDALVSAGIRDMVTPEFLVQALGDKILLDDLESGLQEKIDDFSANLRAFVLEFVHEDLKSQITAKLERQPN